MKDLTPIVLFLIILLAAGLSWLLVEKVIPRIQKLWKPLKYAYPVETAFLEEQIATAINGAEKEFGSGEGATKLEAALEYVQKQAEHYGVHYDEYVVSMKIHAKLHELDEQARAAAAGGK